MLVNTAANWAGTGVATIASLILTPYLLEQLEATRFGLYQINRQFIMYLVLLDLGIIGSVMRFASQAIAARDEARINALTNSALVLYLAIAACGLLVSVLAAGVAPAFFNVEARYVAETRWLFWGLGAWWALTMLAYPAKGILIGHQRYDLLSLITAGGWLLTVALVFGLFELGHASLGALSLAFVTGAVFQLGAAVALAGWLQPGLRWTLRAVDRASLGTLYRFGAWNMLFTIAGLFLWSTDNILIGRLLGPEVVALYAIPFMLINHGRTVVAGFSTPLTPLAAAYGTQNRNLETMLVRSTRVALILALAVNGMLVVLAEDLLRLWIGPAYAGSWIVYAFLMASFWAFYAQRPIYNILMGTGDIRGPAAAVLAATSMTLLAKIVALDWLGFGLEAFALLNCLFILPVMLIYIPWRGARLVAMPLWQLYRRAYAGPLLVFPVVAGAGWLLRSYVVPDNLIEWIIIYALFVLTYLLAALPTLDAADRAAALAILRRPWRDRRGVKTPAAGSL